MLRFLSRRAHGESFQGRWKYLRTKVDGPVDPVWICHAMERANIPLGKGYRKNAFPWMTLVLGSGCLEAREATGGPGVDDLPDAVTAVLASRAELPDGTEPARLARGFTESLIGDRLGERPPTSVPTRPPVDRSAAVTESAVDLILATALLTRIFHQVRSAQPLATSRSGDDVAVLDPELRITEEIVSSQLAPVRTLLVELRDHARSQKERMLENLISAVIRELAGVDGPPALHLVHLRLLTELCWYHLTLRTSVYPGWSDLLLHLSAQEEEAAIDRGRARPAFASLAAATAPIIKRYERATADSWASLDGPVRSDRDVFYDSVAGVVAQQARVRRRYAKKAVGPPVASVFLTTFDLELEMALWARSTEPFVVAVPVNLLTDIDGADGTPASRMASSCWLGCLVTPDHELGHTEQLARLREPGPDQWFVLSAQSKFDFARTYGGMPVVVRLNGCPLLKLPPLHRDGRSTELRRQLVALFREQLPSDGAEPALALTVQHALLLDEYAAMQQTAAEFFNYAPDLVSSNAVRYGLPENITGVDSDLFTRFWTVMGVQVGDSGVRYRFASQLISPKMQSSGGAQPDRSGVVINRRINSAVRDLLYWYGFDVVTARSEDFVEDLDHYVKHLQADRIEASSWDEPCSIA